MTYKVIQWGTGNLGTLAVQSILKHPDLELIGTWVSSSQKAGRDVGELRGWRRPVCWMVRTRADGGRRPPMSAWAIGALTSEADEPDSRLGCGHGLANAVIWAERNASRSSARLRMMS